MFDLLKKIKKTNFFFGFLFILSLNHFSQETDVFEAARRGDISRLKSLQIISKDTLNSINESGFTPLIIACYRGQNIAAEYLLKSGVDLNYMSPEGNALMAAVFHKDLEILTLLLNYSVRTDLRDASGATVLILATKAGDENVVQMLLKHVKDFSARDNFGKTALDYAEEYNFTKIAKLLKK